MSDHADGGSLGFADAGLPETAAPPPPAPAVSAVVAALQPMGRVVAYFRAPLASSPIEQASSSIWLELQPRLGPSYARLTVTADAFAVSIADAPTVRARVREGYVGVGDEQLDFRIGQQIVPWGNGDGVNPTDLLTARDYTFFSADPEANRLGVLMARASYSPVRWLELVLVGTPVAPSSTLLIPGQLLPAGVTLQPLAPPTPTIGNAEEAARVAIHGDSWDLAFIGFRGWNHTPEFALVSLSTTGTVVGLSQHSYVAAGAEASWSLTDWVLRAETAYVATENSQGANPLIQPSHWDTVVGVERAFFEQRLRITAQGISRFHPEYTSPALATGPDPATTATNVAIAQANSILENYVSQFRLAASLRVAYTTSDDKFGAELFATANINDTHDYFLRPLVSWHATDALKFEAGLDYYGGPSTSPLGALNAYSGAFVQATYQF